MDFVCADLFVLHGACDVADPYGIKILFLENVLDIKPTVMHNNVIGVFLSDVYYNCFLINFFIILRRLL